MKEEILYDGITNIREDIIERAEAYVFQGKAENGEHGNTESESGEGKKSRKIVPTWVTVALAAACLVLAVVSPFVYMATRKCGSSGPGEESAGIAPESTRAPGDSGQSEKGNPGDLAPEADAWIYYVEDGEICREQHFVKLHPADIFELWKEKNGIEAEVQLLNCELRSNATTEETVDYLILYLTVSKNLENYYGQTDEELLLDSLKQTMTGYSGLTYQEYHLILE